MDKEYNHIRRYGDSRDILVDEWVIENETIQILKPIYRTLHDYLSETGWSHPQTGNDIFEDLYWERINPNGQKEQWAWWRIVQDKNDYIRYLVVLDMQTLFVSPAETVYKGKKVKAETINLKWLAKFYLQFDIQDKFKNSLAWKFKKAFFNRMYQQEMEQHKGDLLELSEKMNSLIKTMMGMTPDFKWPATQYKPLGYGDWGDDTVRVT